METQTYIESNQESPPPPQRSVLGPTLYLLFTANPQTTATIVDDTAILAPRSNSAITSRNLQMSLLTIQE